MSLPNTILITHGKSEIILFKSLSSRMRVPIIIHSKNDGNETISLASLGKMLSKPPFDSERSLHRMYPELEYLKGDVRMPNLMIIPIVDVDLDGRSRNQYLSGDMFRDSVFRDRILPVINNPNMDVVFERIGMPEVKDKVDYYTRLSMEPLQLYERLKACDGTNMELVIERMMRHCPSFQGKT